MNYKKIKEKLMFYLIKNNVHNNIAIDHDDRVRNTAILGEKYKKFGNNNQFSEKSKISNK
jgi:hypothetical protein